MQPEHTFARGETLPSWWANAIGEFLSIVVSNLNLQKQDDTHIRAYIPGASSTAIGVAGRMRWVENASVVAAHPGGAAGRYDIYATAADDVIVSTPLPYTDNTNRAFALQIVPLGTFPTIVAGTVDIYRRVGYCVWDGAAITYVVQTVGGDTPDMEDLWTAWNPTFAAQGGGLAIGNSAIEAYFSLSGHKCRVHCRLSVGSTFNGGSGGITMTLPLASVFDETVDAFLYSAQGGGQFWEGKGYMPATNVASLYFPVSQSRSDLAQLSNTGPQAPALGSGYPLQINNWLLVSGEYFI